MGAELALAFSAGMVATVNPCGFALLPAYLSYFLGIDSSGSQGPDHQGGNPVLRALAVSAAVTAGFLVVFIIFGVIWTSIREVIGARLPYFTIVVGLALVALGIAMLRGFEPTVSLPKVDLGGRGRQLSSMFLYGISYAVASLSCTIPIFIGIVSTTLTDTGFAAGLATFAAYGLGMGMTLSLLTISVALARSGLVRAFRSLLPKMNRISGVLLIVAGVFVSYYAWTEIRILNDSGSSNAVFDWLNDAQGSMQRWVEGVGAAKLALGAAALIGLAVIVSLLTRSGQGWSSGQGRSGGQGRSQPDTAAAGAGNGPGSGPSSGSPSGLTSGSDAEAR